MSSRNYDFQLNQPVWIRSLEAYRILEEALEEGKISLSDVAQNVEDVNNGATVEALRLAMPVFLEDGIYGAEADREHQGRVRKEPGHTIPIRDRNGTGDRGIR